jgi:hypothetical protein
MIVARKWAHHLPMAKPCVIVERLGAVRLLANAAGPGSIAYPLAGRTPLSRRVSRS